MKTFNPEPAGAEAPVTLPPAPAAVSAEATSLGGQDSVQLIATPEALPVNSPQVAKEASDPASDLGTFSTTAAGSAASALAAVTNQSGLLLDTCGGHKLALEFQGLSTTECSSDQGPLIDFKVGSWEVQVQDVQGNAVPGSAAKSIAAWLRTHSLPEAAKGIISVTVPGADGSGQGTSCQMVWARGADEYQVGGQGGYLSTLDLASAMRPWPKG